MSGPPSGTAVEARGLSPKLLGAGAAIALSALAVVLAVATSGNDAPRPAATTEPTTAPEAPPPQRPAAPTPPLPQFAPTTTPTSQAAAVDQLRRAFAKARLYSQISVQGDELELRSASCEDSQLSALLTQSRTALTESGLHRVRCLQPHGQVVFSREL